MNGTTTDQLRPKWFLKSKTIIGALMMLLPALGNLFGFTVPTDQIANIQDALIKLLEGGATIAGTALVVFGRVKAKRPIVLDPDKE